MAVYALPHGRGLLPQALSHPPTSRRHALLRVAPAALLLLLSLTACRDDSTAIEPGLVAPSFDQVISAPVVTNLLDHNDGMCDDSDCTLREAIGFASSGATITFAEGLTGTITLSGTKLLIAKDLTISGPGATSLTLDGNGTSRVLQVDAGSTVSMSGLTVTGGYTETIGGAGILNSGNLTVADCAISGNDAYYNQGGGIKNMGTLRVVSTTISGNLGHDIAGGVYSSTSTSATFINSTISGNIRYDGSVPAQGIENQAGLLRIIHSTITGNSNGVGIYTGSVEIQSSIIWGNSSNDVSAYTTGLVTSLGYNLIGATTNATFTTTGDQTGVTDAGLAALALNAPGITETHALEEGSPAIDAIPTESCTDDTGAPLSIDQRGVSRPQGSACDIGAYEKNAVTVQDPAAPVVNTLADHDDGSCDTGDCTLREALVQASSGATITFSVTGTITLSTGSDLPVFKDLTIVGPGATELTVDADGTSRVFSVSSGTVTISGLTITGGYAASGGGAGIYNYGDLTVVDCAIVGNNAASGGGGGINSHGTLQVESSTISGNWGTSEAGGVYSNTSTSSTFINSTISGNLQYPDGAGAAAGMYHTGSGVLRVIHSTITGNAAGVLAYAASVQIRGSILSGNSDYDVLASATGLVTSLGYNLVGNTLNATFAADGDQTAVTDANLGPLQLNAPGTTETHALLEGSLAIDAGTCTDNDGDTVDADQRGVSRPQGDYCDIGAYERDSAPAELVVNSLADPGTGGCDATECTLREAIEGSTPGATVTFSPELTGTIVLNTDLQLNWNLTITGPGAEYLTVDANGSGGAPRRAFTVHSTADISGLTVTGGYAEAGGGIWNDGTLTLSNMVVTGNTGSGDGGGIYNSGTLTVSHSTVSDNASMDGGGIKNGGVLAVDHSTISGNTASSYGSGVGGGIQAGPDAVTTTVSNSTISGNMAACRGGGIDNMKMIRIEHTTITGNWITYGDPGLGCGGGGLQSYLDTSDPSLGADIVGSLVWGNLGEDDVPEDVAANVDDGVFNSLGHNLIGAAGYGVVFSEDFAATGDQTGVGETEAVLDALGLNEPGTTETHALPEGSPAIDAGTCTGLDDATVADDQRGVTRPQGSACDIGAYEKASSGEPIDPNFTFDLSTLPAKTYGDAAFPLDSYVTHDGGGAVTFALGTGSAGCSVSGSTVTITGAAVDPAACIITATLAAAAPYAGDEASQSFHIAKAALTVTANNQTITYLDATPTFSVGYSAFVGSDDAAALGGSLVYTFEGTGGTSYGSSTTAPTNAGTYSITPSGLTSADYSFSYVAGTFTINKGTPALSVLNWPSTGTVGEGFTPEVVADGDGATSVMSSTTGICTVNKTTGYVSYIGVGNCTLTAYVAEGTNYLAADATLPDIAVSAPAPIIPTFTFNLSTLGTKTYGDEPFSVADYASSNSSGAITFELGAGSTGCSVTSAGMVTITGAAVDPSACVLMASLAAAAPYAAAGPIWQNFNIAKASTTVSINNLPASGTVGDGFTPTYSSTSDGVKSTTSSTTDICSVNTSTGYVSFDGAGTCVLVAHVAEGSNYTAAEGDPQEIVVSSTGLLTPKFTFDLSHLKQPTFGDAPFSVAEKRYVSTNSTGEITFWTGAGSMGCTVTEAGLVKITHAAVGEDDCVIEAALASDGTYTAAGPISQSFNIAKANATVSISNIPTSADVGGSFAPDYATESDGTTSVVSTTEAVCIVSEGVVHLDAAGTCILVASVDESANFLAATGAPQTFEVGGAALEFSSSCTYSVNSRNDQTDIVVSWANADPGVTSILITDGRDLTKDMAPTPTGSWAVRLKGIPTGYSLFGGDGRAEINETLVEGGQCVESGQQ